MESCIVDLLNKIYHAIVDGDVCEGLMIDLSKAFDIVNHELLLRKLRALGFRMPLATWCKSYLSNQSQSTKANSLSGPEQVSNGMPQGSILVLLLFICYINDLPSCQEHSCANIYAYDTALLTRGRTVTKISNKLQNEFYNIETWFRQNNLSLNENDTL